ncbi:MAG: hypothetical protein RL708_135 [Bacteroidota bacterium]|jgi:hypothetical protein
MHFHLIIKYFISLIIVSALALQSNAQTINYSLPEKNSNKNYDFAVLGKTTEGIIIYKYNKYENVIQCYDNEMNMKWFKEAQLANKNSNIQHISIHNNKLFVFFSYRKGDGVIIAAQRFSAKLEPEGKLKMIDSVSKDLFKDGDDWYVKHSEDKTKYMVYYIMNDGKQSTIIQTILVNDKLRIVKRKSVEVPENRDNMEDELMDNEGNFYFFIADQEHSDITPKIIYTNPRYYRLNNDATFSGVRLLSNPTVRFNSILPKIDNINHALVFAGVAKNKAVSGIAGFQISKWNLKTDSFSLNKFESFADDVIKEMSLTPELDINNYEITDMVLRFDGGIILVTENIYTTQQTIEVPNYYSPSFPTIRTYTYNHKDDVFVQSFDKSAQPDWYKLIRKKQTSESDNGMYSGYGLLKGKNNIQVIYNEQITEQSNLILQTYSADGNVNHGSINSARQKNLMLMPEKASQVSLYEIIIPSQFRGYLQFVKIDF